MKKIMRDRCLLLSGLLSLLTPLLGTGCNVDIQMDTGSAPKAGEIGVIVVNITQTHDPCLLAMEQTKVQTTGLTVLGATPWKESTPKVFTRKFKVKFMEAGEALFEIKRTCPRSVCLKKFRFEVAP